MASAVPPAAAASGAVPAPAAAPAPAAPQTPNEKAAQALGIGQPEPRPAPLQQPQQQQGQPQSAQASRLEQFIQTLPEHERGPYLEELNHLKAQDGRARQLQGESARFQQMQQAAEFAAIQAVRQGADPFTIASQLGVEVGDLMLAVQDAGGLIGSQAPASGAPARPGAAGSDLPPESAAPAPGQSQVPDLQTVWKMHREQSSLAHPKSWTKPLLEARRTAQKQRDLADNVVAQANIEGTDKAAANELAGTYRANADRIEAEAEIARDGRTAGMINAALQNVMSQIKPMLEKIEAAEKEQQQQAAVSQQWGSVVSEIRSARMSDGRALFGPEGYGLMEVDQHGNATRPTPEGQKHFERAQRMILQNGWPRTMRSMQHALDLMASEFVLSEGGSANPAVGQGGSDMLTPGGPVPGNGQFRPSPAGAVRSPSGMY